jgi:adenylate cyclase class IV
MKEIEIRAKIEGIKQIEDSIIKLGGKFVTEEHQIDKVFGREADLDSDHMIIEGHFSARIRQKGETIKVEFNTHPNP